MSITNIFTEVLVLFILILIGYICRRNEILDELTSSKLSSMIMKVFLPAMIINSMQIDYSNDMISKIFTLLVISFFMYLLSFAITLLLKYLIKSKDDIGIYKYAIIFSNVGFMGYPVIDAILGGDALFYTAIFNLPFNLLLITLGAYILSSDKDDYSFNIKNLINPVVISILIGLVLFIGNIKLPIFIDRPLSMLAEISTPLSMLVIGSMLFNSSAKECFCNKNLYIVSFIRLILLPIILYFLLKGFIKDLLILHIPIIISSMPTAANCAIMARDYDNNYTLASQVVFLTTLLSVFTIPLISALLIF